jgi:hypothetical protein
MMSLEPLEAARRISDYHPDRGIQLGRCSTRSCRDHRRQRAARHPRGANLSIDLSAADAERLVESRLTDLKSPSTARRRRSTSSTGWAATWEGDSQLPPDATKKRLAKDLPRLTLQFLEFPFNVGKAKRARRRAGDELFAVQGAVPDPQWRRARGSNWFLTQRPLPVPLSGRS